MPNTRDVPAGAADDRDRGGHPEHPDHALPDEDRLPDDDLLDDDRLLAELRSALAEVAAVPERARSAARAAFTWRTVDEELMRLVHDSWAAQESLVRGPSPAGGPTAGPGSRVVSFEADGFSVELEISEGTVLGQVVPGRACRVTAEHRDGSSEAADADDAGYFVLVDSGRGPVRFTVDIGGRRHTTPWLGT